MQPTQALVDAAAPEEAPPSGGASSPPVANSGRCPPPTVVEWGARLMVTLVVLGILGTITGPTQAHIFAGQGRLNDYLVYLAGGAGAGLALRWLYRWLDRAFAPPPADPNELPPISLKPAGHNPFAEWMATILIPVGSTTLVAIACYVLAQNEIQKIAAGTAQGGDYFVVSLVVVLGFMVDTALIVSSARFKMHLARGRREIGWTIVTGVMLVICLAVEAMTLMYFGYLVSPAAVPDYVVQVIKHIHDILFFIRNGLPPVIIAFFATCLMPLSVEPSDRDRATKAESSMHIMALQQMLIKPGLLKTHEDMIVALESQMHLNEHAAKATDEEKTRNTELLNELRRTYGLPVQQQTKLAPDQVTRFEADMQAMREQLAAVQAVSEVVERLKAFSPAELEQRFADWADRMAQQFAAQFAQAQDRLALMLVEQGDGDTRRAVLANSALPGNGDGPKARPKPGTKAYKRWVRQEIQAIEAQGNIPTVAALVERLKEPEVNLLPVFEEWQIERAALT